MPYVAFTIFIGIQLYMMFNWDNSNLALDILLLTWEVGALIFLGYLYYRDRHLYLWDKERMYKNPLADWLYTCHNCHKLMKRKYLLDEHNCKRYIRPAFRKKKFLFWPIKKLCKPCAGKLTNPKDVLMEEL